MKNFARLFKVQNSQDEQIKTSFIISVKNQIIFIVRQTGRAMNIAEIKAGMERFLYEYEKEFGEAVAVKRRSLRYRYCYEEITDGVNIYKELDTGDGFPIRKLIMQEGSKGECGGLDCGVYDFLDLLTMVGPLHISNGCYAYSLQDEYASINMRVVRPRLLQYEPGWTDPDELQAKLVRYNITRESDNNTGHNIETKGKTTTSRINLRHERTHGRTEDNSVQGFNSAVDHANFKFEDVYGKEAPAKVAKPEPTRRPEYHVQPVEVRQKPADVALSNSIHTEESSSYWVEEDDSAVSTNEDDLSSYFSDDTSLSDDISSEDEEFLAYLEDSDSFVPASELDAFANSDDLDYSGPAQLEIDNLAKQNSDAYRGGTNATPSQECVSAKQDRGEVLPPPNIKSSFTGLSLDEDD